MNIQNGDTEQSGALGLLSKRLKVKNKHKFPGYGLEPLRSNMLSLAWGYSEKKAS